jgi:DNA-binding GntR family transcriptional regulator
MHPSSPIRSVREQIADQLRNEIMADEIPANEPLREVALAERFGTSRGPIRDVLLQLSQEGALIYKPNSGVRVSPPLEKADRTLLMTLRRQIELKALSVFVRELTDDDEYAMRDILDAMHHACLKEEMSGIVGADISLHRLIVKRGSSHEVEAVWGSIAVRIRMEYSRVQRVMDIFDEHKRLVEAICGKDRKKAADALTANLI